VGFHIELNHTIQSCNNGGLRKPGSRVWRIPIRH